MVVDVVAGGCMHEGGIEVWVLYNDKMMIVSTVMITRETIRGVACMVVR